MAKFNIGTNIVASVEGKKLTLVIDIGESGHLSGSGKNMTLATTGSAQAVGNTPDGRPIKLNLSAYAPIPA